MIKFMKTDYSAKADAVTLDRQPYEKPTQQPLPLVGDTALSLGPGTDATVSDTTTPAS